MERPHKGHSGHYTLLMPENASPYDLVLLLLSSKSDTRRFIQSTEEQFIKGDIRRRWYLIISIVAQKLLLYLGMPMILTGKILELCLNLLSGNGMDRSSAKFTSVVGNIDKRVELDKNIRPGNPKYNASLAMMASKLAYENEAFGQATVEDQWRMKYLEFYSFWNDYIGKISTQAMMFQDTRVEPNLIVVAFSGTHPFDPVAWQTDIDQSWLELKGVGNVHVGFMKALGLQKDKGWPKETTQLGGRKQFAYYAIRQKLREILEKNENAKFILTGHSLGGALAILFVTVLAMHEEELLLNRLEGVYTFGQPRVGDEQLGDYMKEKMNQYDVKYLRCVYCNDMVPRIPYDNEVLLYKHWAPCLYDNSCLYKGEVLSNELNKNHFSLVWAIPKRVNAAWEFLRSFIIPHTRGHEYKESWLMRIIAVIGLVFPGIAAHCPQDYVNATGQLGILPLELREPLDMEVPYRLSVSKCSTLMGNGKT